MLKRILFAILTVLSFSTAYAGSFYMGPHIALIDTTSQNGSYRGVEPRLTFGYGDMMTIYSYLGGEIFASAFSAVLSNNTPNATSLKTTRSFGASLIPGYMINQSAMGYLRLGMISSEFSGPNTTKSGAQIGIGMQTSLDRNWSVRGEYTYTAYATVHQLGAPKTDQFMIGFLYYFV